MCVHVCLCEQEVKGLKRTRDLVGGERQGMDHVRHEVGFGSEWFLVRVCTSSRGAAPS